MRAVARGAEPTSQTVTVTGALADATAHLAARGVDSPRLDAEHLLARVLGIGRLELVAERGRPLDGDERRALRTLVERRGRREPLAYVLGDWDFRRLTLRTDARALVPRPETESVVERCIALLAAVESPRVVDVGTGSGAIALSLALEVPGARVTATDVSSPALALARENAAATGLDVAFVETDLLDGLTGPFDLVVSNPPYVGEDELTSVEAEVRDWEPHLALVDAGQTVRLARAARSLLVGSLVLEVHAGRADEVAGELAALGYEHVAIGRDLAGRDRVVEGRWTPSPAR